MTHGQNDNIAPIVMIPRHMAAIAELNPPITELRLHIVNGSADFRPRRQYLQAVAFRGLNVLAVTHTPPTTAADTAVFPQDIKRHLGLDDAPSWIVTPEANAFIWPGPFIRPVPSRSPTTVIYGRVPNGKLRQVARSYLAKRDEQRSRLVPRTEWRPNRTFSRFVL